MANLDKDELYELYQQADDEAHQWKEDYSEFERLADNGIAEDIDENLPEVNDGTLAASLFKLPKRIVSSKLTGRAKALDSDDAWITELANMQWENNIIPNANSQAPFHRKWKDAVRKAAIYGSVPLITIFSERGNYTGVDFIVAQPQDVIMEPGKVSDYDSDIFYWNVYFSKLQLKNIIEQAKEESKGGEDNEGFSKWDVPALEDILARDAKEDRDGRDIPEPKEGKGVERGGFKFCIVFQRGVEAPFYMYHKSTNKTVREWTNPDPSGDVPIHYLYCYQDFINPYGIGIVKLAGGTQNVLDYMRQADVLATQLGLEPPIKIQGDADSADIDSMVYERKAVWLTGNATVEKEELSTQVYQQLPTRVGMYKTSLNQLIPTGDTSISAESGDPNYSKTPAGVKFQQSNLSIDDEDFKDNLYMTFEAVAKNMINTHFANMQGTDLMKLKDEQREIMAKAGIDFPLDEEGNPTNELEIIWDDARATFDFEVEAEQDKATDDQKRLEGLLRVAELKASDPQIELYLQQSGKRLNTGELFSEIIKLTSDNDKIIEDIDPEELEAQEEQQQLQQGMQEPIEGEVLPQEAQQPQGQPEIADEEIAANMQAVMEQYGIDEQTAAALLEAERQGLVNSPEEAVQALQAQGGQR